MILSGYAYINGVRADDGTPVVATIDDVTVASVVTKTSNSLKGYFVFSFINDTDFNLHLFVAGIEANESPILYNRWLGGMGNCLDSPKDLHVQMTTQFNLDLTAVNGSITANPPGPYYYGDEVTLTAAADTGYHFTGWSGDAEGDSSTTTLYINGNKSVTANFAINTYGLTINTTGSGSVGANPASSEYEHGTQVELSAEADLGWTFAGWSGDLQGTENPQSLIMDGPKSVSAVFTQDEYTLTITAEHGTVDASPAGPYHYGDQVTLTAAADPNFHL
jgi:uncharacterized repeat protein (TIGR02543 family)